MHMGGGHMGGGGMRGGGAHFAGGAAHMGGGPRFTGGGVNTAARVAAAPGAGRTFAGNRTGWNGGHWRGGRYHHRHFFPGFAAGAVIGGLGSYGYYGGPDYYYGPDYDDSYYDTGPEVAVVPGGGDAVAYCEQRFKSYDPASGTYLGYDGKRHPCP